VERDVFLFLTETVQFASLFSKELATACESPLDFFTMTKANRKYNDVDEGFWRF